MSYVYLVSGVKYSLLLEKLAVVIIVTIPAPLFCGGWIYSVCHSRKHWNQAWQSRCQGNKQML